jgi:TetR/AcrR family transcriptional repressor of nem operon
MLRMRYAKDHSRLRDNASSKRPDGVSSKRASTAPARGCAHFASKEDLVANVLADQLRAQRERFDDQPSDRTGLEAIIRSYLSPQHPNDADAARTDALAIFGMMIGTLQLARALTDRDLSDQLLVRGVETALKLLDDRA